MWWLRWTEGSETTWRAVVEGAGGGPMRK